MASLIDVSAPRLGRSPEVAVLGPELDQRAPQLSVLAALGFESMSQLSYPRNELRVRFLQPI
jgi:hypothetical protein